MVSCEVGNTRSSLTRFHPHHRQHAIVIFFHSLELDLQLGGKILLLDEVCLVSKSHRWDSSGYIIKKVQGLGHYGTKKKVGGQT